MKNTIRVVPMGTRQMANGESAAQGEGMVVKNLREREDALEVVGNCPTIAKLADGERLVMVDRHDDADRYITVKDGTLMLHGIASDGIYQELGEVITDVAGDIVSAEECGQFVVINTTAGLVYLLRRRTKYTVIDKQGATVMLKLAATEQETISQPLGSYQFRSTYTSWTSLRADDLAVLSSNVRTAYRNLQASASAQGKLSGMVLARCGLRLWDDSYLWMSAPTLIGGDLTSDWATAPVTSVGAITGIESSDASLQCYRLGITPIQMFDSQWDGLIKAVDILVSNEVPIVDLSGSMDYRCTTSQSGSRTQSLLLAPKSVNRQTIANRLLNSAQWHVMTSTSNFEALRNGRWKASNTATSSRPEIVGRTTAAVIHSEMKQTAIYADCTAATISSLGSHTKIGGQLFGANLTLCHNMPWHIADYFGSTASGDSCVATIAVTFATSNGNQQTVSWENVPFTPTGLCPIIVYPDSRATHIAIEMQSTGDVMTWESDLMPLADRNMAVAISNNLTEHQFTASSEPLITIPDKQSWSERAESSIAVSKKGNPLVMTMHDALSGTSITAIATTLKPIYNGGFGRYPLITFSANGIYALPQSTNGNFGDARLISRQQQASGTSPCEGGEAIYFVNSRGDLMALNGQTVTRKLRKANAQAMAWNDAEQELWMLHPDGSISVMMPSGRTYWRTTTAQHLYSQNGLPLAVAGGEVLDIANEQRGAMDIEWFSHPIVVTGMLGRCPRRVSWNVFGNAMKLQLQVTGEQGTSCHGFRISTINIDGKVNSPVEIKLFSPKVRTIRLSIRGKMLAKDLILPEILSLL